MEQMASTSQPAEPEASDRCCVPTAAEEKSRRGQALWASLIPGVLIATLFWLVGEVNIALLVSIAVTILMGLILARRPNAFCPECQCEWHDDDAEGQNETKTRTPWKLCSGCYLKLEERGELPEGSNDST